MTGRGRAQERREAEVGAVVVEFAMVFVVFVTLLWGLVSYGVIFAAQQSIAHAAGEATRAGVGVADEAAAEALAEAVANDQLAWLGAPASTALVVDAQVDACDFDPALRCLVVEVTYDWANDPIVPSLLDVATPDTLTGRAVLKHG